ncbi:MAG: hypothetical protein CM15mP62_30210 [Rhodospirillaceae bacterium]|nr:MAG: hypothetical protein CM15mP62_30210 [Rhodospirillaceae bacterium]
MEKGKSRATYPGRILKRFIRGLNHAGEFLGKIYEGPQPCENTKDGPGRHRKIGADHL